jgi:hypothetical protein
VFCFSFSFGGVVTLRCPPPPPPPHTHIHTTHARLSPHPFGGALFISFSYELFFLHVGDNIWSVRENAAVALGEVVKTYGDDAFATAHAKLLELLPSVSKQPAGSKKNSGLTNATQFGVAGVSDAFGWAGDEDAVVATSVDGASGDRRRFVPLGEAAGRGGFADQQMFSCGSLAPKLKRKGGCMDCGFMRPQEPWELTDGAL